MSEAEEEDAIGGTCECKEEIEILAESEGKRHKNGNGSSVPRGGCSLTRTDMDNSYLPPLSDDIALLILARLPSSKHYDLLLVNRRFHSLIKSGELNEIRKNNGLKEPKLFLLSRDPRYRCYEPYTRSCWDLPVCPYDETTEYRCKESFCVGTHLLVLGVMKGDIDLRGDFDIWRYELELNRWFDGPMMITSRYFFASADCDSVACVAGGNQQGSDEVLNSAEKYNPENKSWELLPSMNRRRSFCSGFYMDRRLHLMANLMVVVNNELYYLEFPSCHLKVYLKNNNTWKKVGRVPASIELFDGWGVALKSLGNELLLIGRTPRILSTLKTILCFCTPSPELDDVEWHVLDLNRQGWNPTIYNSCVMMV